LYSIIQEDEQLKRFVLEMGSTKTYNKIKDGEYNEFAGKSLLDPLRSLESIKEERVKYLEKTTVCSFQCVDNPEKIFSGVRGERHYCCGGPRSLGGNHLPLIAWN
jgi:hypothetical protein